MATKKLGKQTVRFQNPPVILSSAAIAGPKEGEGPLGLYFDQLLKDNLFEEETWEKAERKMLFEAIILAMNKIDLVPEDIDFMLAGDLLNQIISANYTARQTEIPFIGLYGACSTMAESLALGSILIDGGFAAKVVCGASSHYNTAERQYRFPTELGVQRPPTAQWTVTGAGATVLGESGKGLRVSHATFGKVVDLGISDANDMGSAMAPAVADTIVTHFQDIGGNETYYDLIITGDMGNVGKGLVQQLVAKEGYNIADKYTDCGVLVFDPAQDTHAGGSGCGCSAIVFNSYLLHEILGGKFKKVLFIGSGALLSPTALQQGESIPGIGHAVVIEA
ncbi:MAG: stage V sporulation protein AD [Clostridia bacterium]|nr:stage V sporulation protein AD [Clostridia bacterium]